MEVNIDNDLVSEIVIKDLKDGITTTLEDPYELYFDDDGAYMLVESMLDVLKYYMVEEDYEDFVKTLPQWQNIPEASEITVAEIVENDDGSADVCFDLPKKDVGKFASEGVKYVLLKSVLGNPTDDQLIKWAERGKQEQRTDNKVDQLLKDLYNG